LLSAYSKPHKLPANFAPLNLLLVFNHLANFLPSSLLTNFMPVPRRGSKPRFPPPTAFLLLAMSFLPHPARASRIRSTSTAQAKS
jgi:hypothetical protein